MSERILSYKILGVEYNKEKKCSEMKVEVELCPSVLITHNFEPDFEIDKEVFKKIAEDRRKFSEKEFEYMIEKVTNDINKIIKGHNEKNSIKTNSRKSRK